MQDLIDAENKRLLDRAKAQDEIFAKCDDAINAAQEEARVSLKSLQDADAAAALSFGKALDEFRMKEKTLPAQAADAAKAEKK